MSNIFDEFTNVYPVSKTLRFELIPEKDTLHYLEKNGVLGNDEKKAEDYKKLKMLLDEYYRAYIEGVLSEVELEGLDKYASLYSTKSKTSEEKEQFETVQDMLRLQINSILESGEKYGILFKKEVIEKELITFLAGREDDINVVKAFKGFTSICQGFFDNRKNIFTAEKISTSIAYRTIHDNLPKFMNNLKIYTNHIKGQIDVPKELLEKIGVECIDDIFDIDYFSKTLSQSGIEKYNILLGGFTIDEKTKVQGINELINLFNQRNQSIKIPTLQPLFKQILSEKSSISFIAERFEDDNEVIGTVRALCDEFFDACCTEDSIAAKLFSDVYQFETDGIFIKNDRTLTYISNVLFSEWNAVGNYCNSWYDAKKIGTQKSEEKYLEARKAYFKRMDSLSLGFIESVSNTKLGEMISREFRKLSDSLSSAYNNAEQLLCNEYDQSRNLINDDDAIKQIKLVLDSMKSLEAFIKVFSGTGQENDRDEMFYSEISQCFYVFEHLDSIYNNVRNYVTQKPYKTEKVKLTFDIPTLLNGWDINKETDNKAVILRKDDIFYLGIINKEYSKVFVNIKEGGNECYEKMEYKLLPGANKMLPKVFFAKSNIDYYAPGEELLENYKKGTHKKGKDFNIKDCHELIDFFKASINKHPDWSNFGFEFSDTSTYEDISGFYREVEHQGYKISFKNISADYIDELVSTGKLYLFKIYNKDFSAYSKGRPNLHTLYWKALFDPENTKNIVYKLNGQAEVFYRKKSISEEDRIVHPANVSIENKNSDNVKECSLFDYDIIKDRRYTVDKFQFHVPITMNFTAMGRGKINLEMRSAIKHSKEMHIIGIDRGERHLLYVSVIDLKGNIKEQFSLNEILSEYKGQSYTTNYHKLLDCREEERAKARQEWKSIENIKELKDGYMSQVVHIIAKLMIKYNAIVVLEDLNSGFKRGRQKVEKQVYQKFEKALIDKLNYLVDKTAEQQEVTGLYKALQLTEKFESFSKMSKQNGAIFYVPAWNTSKMDPTTGFVNMLNTKYENIAKSKAFIEKMGNIRLIRDGNNKYFAFDIDYNDFTEKAEGTRTKWTVCSYGTRIVSKRNKEGYWEDKELDITSEFEKLFSDNGIDVGGNIKEQILIQTSAEFYKRLMWLLKVMLQIRNSETNGVRDYMISPVMNDDGRFFCSDDVNDGSLPVNADANGAYNIARKGLWIVEQFKSLPENKLKNAKLSMTNKEWLHFAQR